MTAYDYMMECKPVDRTTFKKVVLGLRYAFCSEIPTETGRLMLVRAGDERGTLVGYREDYQGNVHFYAR